MTSAIRINHFDKEILISKSFEKAAHNPNSREYKELMEVMNTHTVSRHVHEYEAAVNAASVVLQAQIESIEGQK